MLTSRDGVNATIKNTNVYMLITLAVKTLWRLRMIVTSKAVNDRDINLEIMLWSVLQILRYLRKFHNSVIMGVQFGTFLDFFLRFSY